MKFSIIIPALNEEKYIGNCLASIVSQKYPKKDYEIIVVDGNSKDRTREIAKKYARVVIEKKRGIAVARNKGASLAKGEIFIFMDSDSVVTNNLFHELEEAFYDKDVVGATVKLMPDPVTFRFAVSTFLITMMTRISSLLGKPLGTTICISCRKDAFWRINGFKERLYSGEDVDFVFRLGHTGKFKLLTNVYAVTSMRRIERWGEVYFLYRYLRGAGLISQKEYGRVD